MKKILKFTALSAVLLMLAAVLVSCNDRDKNKDEPPFEEAPFLSLDKALIVAKAEGGLFSIAVSSNRDWIATAEDVEWIQLTKNSDTLFVAVSENLEFSERQMAIKITAENLTEYVLVNQDATEEPDSEYPVEISFTVPAFWAIFCFWGRNLNHDGITIINSQEQMENYLECSRDTIPQIDFSQYTLLVASGVESAILPLAVPIAFYRISKNKYSLEVTLCGSLVGVNVRWAAAALVPKISNEVRVELVIVDDAFSDYHPCRILF